MPTESPYMYVDANYVRMDLKAAGQPGLFNPSNLWNDTNAATPEGYSIRAVRMFFYDAIDDKASEDEKAELQEYLQRVEEIPYVSVSTGFVRPGKKKPREQKGVDVQIAVDALEAAWSGRADAIILIAGDADFCPLAEAVRRAGAFIYAFGFQGSMSKELQNSVDVFSYLPPQTFGRLGPFK